MPDLHAWITQRIDRVENDLRSVDEEHGRNWTTRWNTSSDTFTIYDDNGSAVAADFLPAVAGLVVANDPAAVLRRCAADRKILARHRLAPEWPWAHGAPCHGCGVMGDCDDPVTDNLNDCPELLDLAEGHGLTPEILAALDRPEPPPKSDCPGATGSVVMDSIGSMYAQMLAAVDETVTRTLVDGDGTGMPLGFRIIDAPREEPTAMDRALALLDPELRRCPLYRPKYAYGGILSKGFGVTADRPLELLRDPHWRVHP